MKRHRRITAQLKLQHGYMVTIQVDTPKKGIPGIETALIESLIVLGEYTGEYLGAIVAMASEMAEFHDAGELL